MMPSANRANVASPASGRSASAACVAELMLVMPLALQDGRRRQDDEERDRVREDHPDRGVDLDAVELGDAASGELAKRAMRLALVHLLDLLRGLPEEQIGADGGAEHGDHHQEIIGIDVRLRPHGRQQRRAPRDLHREGGRDVGEQRQRQEFQDRRIAAIGDEDLQQGRAGGEDQRVLVIEPANDQRQRLRHRGDVGGDVEGVRDDQQSDQRQHQPARRHLHHVGSEALAGDPPDQRAHELDRDHERDGEEDRPQQPVAELRAGLRIGRDAGWIVVGRAGDQARARATETISFRAFLKQGACCRSSAICCRSYHGARSKRLWNESSSVGNAPGTAAPKKKPVPESNTGFRIYQQRQKLASRRPWPHTRQPVGDAEQDAKTHFEAGAGVDRMRALASIAAEYRTDIVAAGAQVLTASPARC